MEKSNNLLMRKIYFTYKGFVIPEEVFDFDESEISNPIDEIEMELDKKDELRRLESDLIGEFGMVQNDTDFGYDDEDDDFSMNFGPST